MTSFLKRFLLFSSLILAPLVARQFLHDLPTQQFPSAPVFLIWLAPILIAVSLRSPFNRFVAASWMIWFSAGSVNIVATYYASQGNYLLRTNEAALIFTAYTFTYFAGMFASEYFLYLKKGRHAEPTPPLIRDQPSLTYSSALILFPLIYFLSMYLTLGYVPLFQGVDFYAEIYELRYGPLYGFGIILVFAMLHMLHACTDSGRWLRRLLWIAAFLVTLIISIADGKRYYVVIFTVAALPFVIRLHGAGHGPRKAGVLAVVMAGVVLYLAVLAIRTGGSLDNLTAVELQLASVGVEYRDFVYSVNNLKPGHVPGYDWFRSAVFSGLNGTLLSGFGIDKEAEVLRGSAYVWRDILASNFGIRTGLASELYFAYGWLGVPVILLIGMGAGLLGVRLSRTRRRSSLTFLSVVYALVLLALVGQTTATVGLLTPVVYLYIAYRLLDGVEPKLGFRRQLAPPSAP